MRINVAWVGTLMSVSATPTPCHRSPSTRRRGPVVAPPSSSTRQTDGCRPRHPMARNVMPLTVSHFRAAAHSIPGRTSS